MDPKKQQDLTPELKQIYDRVMNTEVKGNTPPAATKPTTPSIPLAAATPEAKPATPTTNLGEISGSTPNAPKTDAFLSSTPPRPLSDDKSFVFTGNKVTTAQGATPTHTEEKTVGGKKLSPPIIGVIVVVGILVWGLIWAKIFGLV